MWWLWMLILPLAFGCHHSSNHCRSRFSRQGWVIGQNWVGGNRLDNYSHLKPSLHLHIGSLLLSAFLGTGVFLGKEFLLGKNMLVHGWLPSLPSSSKYVFIFLIRDG